MCLYGKTLLRRQELHGPNKTVNLLRMANKLFQREEFVFSFVELYTHVLPNTQADIENTLYNQISTNSTIYLYHVSRYLW